MMSELHNHDEIEKVGLTADEKLWVMQSASAHGLSRSSYIRSLIVAERLRVAQRQLWHEEQGNVSTKVSPIDKE
jgi:hypothetical protein